MLNITNMFPGSRLEFGINGWNMKPDKFIFREHLFIKTFRKMKNNIELEVPKNNGLARVQFKFINVKY